MSNNKAKTIIGCVEQITLPMLDGRVLLARIDTGAQTSSIWASEVAESDNGLIVCFASGDGEIEEQRMTFSDYKLVRVKSSMGHREQRYKIKMPAVIKGRKIITTFTLSDRSEQTYPVLIGRSTLKGNFVVDVALREQHEAGSSLKDSNILKTSK